MIKKLSAKKVEEPVESTPVKKPPFSKKVEVKKEENDDASMLSEDDEDIMQEILKRKTAQSKRIASDILGRSQIIIEAETATLLQVGKPHAFTGHSLKVGEQYPKVACHKELGKKTCPYCDEKIRAQEFVVFPVLDYRGKYITEVQDYEGGFPVVQMGSGKAAKYVPTIDEPDSFQAAEKPASKYLLVGLSVAETIITKMRGRNDSGFLQVERTGTGTSTVYTYSFVAAQNVSFDMYEGDDVKFLDVKTLFSEPVTYDTFTGGYEKKPAASKPIRRVR